MERGLRWRVGDGRCIRTRHDPWIPRPYTFRPRSLYCDLPLRVADLIDPKMGTWKTSLVWSYFDKEESSIILGLPISLAGCKDRLIWHYLSNGGYTVHIGYEVAMEMWANGEHERMGTGGGGGVAEGMIVIIFGGIFGD